MARANYKTDVDWDNPKEVKEYNRKRAADRRKDPVYIDKIKKRYLKNKSKAIEYTGGLQCHNPECIHIKHGENLELCQIDFHHVITENKKYGFNILFRFHKWETIQAEIDNCDAVPLCANCHRMTFFKF